ncbi:YjbF family lipoprotein [Gammaproteobacteria bacterium]|nr:YjbF family lipoprotein [Gammaproteobacteria bacterium]
MINLKIVLITALLISSCSGISYQQVFPLIKGATIGYPDLIITQEIIDSRTSSFIKASFGRGRGVIMVLASIDSSGIFEWVSEDGEALYTLNGKVIRTSGLPYNMSYVRNISPKFYSKETVTTPAKLMNPLAYITFILEPASDEVAQIDLPNPIDVRKFVINSSISELNWTRENIYYVDLDTNIVIKTIQHLHPRLPKLEIEYYLKF